MNSIKYKELIKERDDVTFISIIDDDRKTSLIVEKIESIIVDFYHKDIFVSNKEILQQLNVNSEEQEINDIIDYTLAVLNDYHLLEIKQFGIEGNKFKLTKKGLAFIGFDSPNIIVMSMIYFFTLTVFISISFGYLPLNIFVAISIVVVYIILGTLLQLNADNRIKKLAEKLN